MIPVEMNATPGGIVIPKEHEKSEKWSITIGMNIAGHSIEEKKLALEKLYEMSGDPAVRSVVDALAYTLVGRVPEIEELC